jgi:hypothetical protein
VTASADPGQQPQGVQGGRQLGERHGVLEVAARVVGDPSQPVPDGVGCTNIRRPVSAAEPPVASP